MAKKIPNNELKRLSVEEFGEHKKSPIVVVLDNIRSQHNVGSAFRSSDAFLVEKIYLCGITGTPPTAEIHKAALGAEFSMDWEYFEKTIEAVESLKGNGYEIVSIEQVEGAVMLNDFIPDRDKKYAFIFGNEVKGVDQQVVDNSDLCIEIPQFGTKHSLNVSVSIGVVLWSFTQLVK